jgi:hypothetical protein
LAACALACLALAAAVLVVARPVLDFLMLGDAFWPSAHPSDESLVRQFKRNRVTLEELVAMAKRDPELTRMGMDFTRPEDTAKIGIPPERLARYRELCRAAGITYGFHRNGDAVFFIVHIESWFSGKGLLYQPDPDPDAEIVEDTDIAYAKHETRSNVTFEHRIEGPWWVELDVR